MKTCPYCQHQFEGDPRYCPNCGRINYDDVTRNMLWVRQRIDSGTATQDDLDFIKAVQKDVDNAKPIDARTPIEELLDWRGWWIVIIIAGASAIWGNLDEYLASFLFGFCLLGSGALIFRTGAARGKGEIYAIVFFVGGLILMGYSIFMGISSLF